MHGIKMCFGYVFLIIQATLLLNIFWGDLFVCCTVYCIVPYHYSSLFLFFNDNITLLLLCIFHSYYSYCYSLAYILNINYQII